MSGKGKRKAKSQKNNAKIQKETIVKEPEKATKSIQKEIKANTQNKQVEEKRKGMKWSKGILYGCSFIIPAIVLLLILKTRGFYPFGDKTLFIMDMKGQYLEFFASLRNVVNGDDSLFFSWSRSMGGNYLGLFAYYVASPLSFITVFFPLEKMTIAILLLTVLKIGLAGLSFASFGGYIWEKVNSEKGKDSFKILIVLPFAVSYALISYNMVYSMCLMWLDGVILLPMVLLGVEKILDGRKGFHYMLALAAIFICNYYTGYMVGIFTAIYFVYRVLSRVKKDTIKEYLWKTLRFTGVTFLSFGISAPLILPVVKDLMQGKLVSASYVPDIETNFVFADLFGKLKNGVYDSITNSGLPAIYCGYIALIMALVFFVMRGINIREKIGAVAILGLLAASFYYTKWDIAWHGFQYPTWFPYRYAFVCSFFILYMAMRGTCALFQIEKIKKLQMPQVVVAASILTLVVSVEMNVNGKAMFAGLEGEFGYGTVEEYESFLNKTQPLVEEVQAQDEGFYRMNQGYEYSKNDAMLLGYNGMTHYSSTFHASVNQLTPKLGIAQSHIWNSGYGSNPMLDSLFGVGYILDDGMVPANYPLLMAGENGANAYSNENVLPVAYGAPVTQAYPDLNNADPFVNQNTFLNSIAGTEKAYFTEYEYTYAQPDHTWSYTFVADSDNPVYLYMKSDNISWADVYVNDVWVGNYFSTETSCSLYLGNFQPGQPVVVRVVPSDNITVNYAMIAQLHMDQLTETMNALKNNGMQIAKHNGGKLSGTIQVGENQKIITSIPYDTGWTVKIDGKKIETSKFADTFLMVEAESGEHDISFSYVSPGFGVGMILFVVAVLLASVYFVFFEKFYNLVHNK